MKLVTWEAKDTKAIFGERSVKNSENTLTNVKINGIAHTQSADQYLGLCFETEPVAGTTVINIEDVPENTFYFFYNPSAGMWANANLINQVVKDLRQYDLDKLTVTLENGVVLNADEKSQERLNRAYTILGDTGSTTWKDADNKFVTLTGTEIFKALEMAGAKQSALWTEYTLELAPVEPVADTTPVA